VSSRVVRVNRRANFVSAAIQRSAGPAGWYKVDWFSRLRGLIDQLRGGVGLQRQRRHHHYELRGGEPVDFWRIEQLKRGSLLLLAAEMTIPGRRWLEFDV
jgi:hypothetical protein